jgi:hypothetical protein
MIANHKIMPDKLRLIDLFEGKRYQKIILAVSVILFLVLELIIYLGAASQAGRKSRVIVTNAVGEKVWEAQGSTLTSYEKMLFENTHGPLRDYTIKLESEQLPFPFRAWMTAAVGIPVGLILLTAFLIRVYLALLYGDEKAGGQEAADSADSAGRFGLLHRAFDRVSVFHIGFAVLVAVLLLWMVPNFIEDFTKLFVAAIREYRWFFLGAALFFGLLISWIIYLRYKLSKQMLENQFNLEKYRLDKQLLIEGESRRLLPDSAGEAHDP